MSRAYAFLIGGSFLMGLSAMPALAQDAENGHIVFLNECYECHTTELSGQHRQGPNLHGIFGGRVASSDFLRYSPAFRALDFTWDEEKLNEYIANPRKMVPGTTERSAGVQDADERADLIAYLKGATAAQ